MKFDYEIYRSGLISQPGIFLVAGLLILVFAFLVYFKTNFVSRIFRRDIYKNSAFAYLIPVLLAFAIFLPQMNFSLIFEQEDKVVEQIGEIESINPSSNSNRFHYNGNLVYPKYITIEDEEYFIMYTGVFEVGDVVEITYLPKSKIVLEIQEVVDE